MEHLADAVAQRLGMSEALVGTVLQASLHEIADALLRDGRVQLTHFGVFELRLRRERSARNPRTGERLTIPPKVRVVFKASPALQAHVQEFAGSNRGPAERPDDPSGEENANKPWWRFWR